MARVQYSGNIISPNENIFVYTYSSCQEDMVMLFNKIIVLDNIVLLPGLRPK